MKYILVINPGSTSTKIALFAQGTITHETNLEHDEQSLKKYESINEQWPMRKEAIETWLKSLNIDFDQIKAIAARGGITKPLETGAYRVDQALRDALFNSNNPHASNLAGVIAYDFAEENNLPAYIYDAVCGMGKPEPIYAYSGLEGVDRPYLTHVLNSRAVCFHHAQLQAEDIYQNNYIVVHMGGGITTNLVAQGKIIDFVGDDEGTFSPERAGRIPTRILVKLCYSGKYSEKEMQRQLKGQGGLISYLNTNDLRQAEHQAYQEGDKKAFDVLAALHLQIAKDIASLAPVVEGNIQGILLTGGMAHSASLTAEITKRVKFIAPVYVYAGTREMEALALGIERVLQGEEKAYNYE
ncbi:MAG: butyrate kinase [Firmicutes bacterium]|nr:butyrate kinase [Bacillota bacterium]